MLFGQLLARVTEQLLVVAAFLCQTPLQGALTEVQAPRQFAAIGFAARQLLAQQGHHPCTQAFAGQACEQGFGMLTQQVLQRWIGLDQRRTGQRAGQYDAVIAGGKLQGAGEGVDIAVE